MYGIDARQQSRVYLSRRLSAFSSVSGVMSELDAQMNLRAAKTIMQPHRLVDIASDMNLVREYIALTDGDCAAGVSGDRASAIGEMLERATLKAAKRTLLFLDALAVEEDQLLSAIGDGEDKGAHRVPLELEHQVCHEL